MVCAGGCAAYASLWYAAMLDGANQRSDDVKNDGNTLRQGLAVTRKAGAGMRGICAGCAESASDVSAWMMPVSTPFAVEDTATQRPA